MYSMTITFLALVSLLPQQLTKLHQLAMQQTPFPPLGQTNPAFPGTYPAAPSDPLSPPRGLLFALWLCSGREQSSWHSGGRVACALPGRAGGPCVPEVGWSSGRPMQGRLPGACPAERTRPASHVPFGSESVDARTGVPVCRRPGRVPRVTPTPDGACPPLGKARKLAPQCRAQRHRLPAGIGVGGPGHSCVWPAGSSWRHGAPPWQPWPAGAHQTHWSAAASQVLSFPSRVALLISLRAKR